MSAEPYKTIRSKLWYLQNTNLFQSLSPQEIDELSRVTSMASVDRGKPVYLPGDPSDLVYILKSGQVKLSRVTEDGETITLAILKPGEIFGELEALDQVPYDTLAEALDQVTLCMMKRGDFLAMLQKRPDLMLRLTKLIGARLRSIASRIEDLVFRDVATRLAHLLVQLAAEFGRPEGSAVRLEIRLTHQEMANLIGSSRETVTATLSEFRREGLIRLDGRDIVILDLDRLKALGAPRSGRHTGST